MSTNLDIVIRRATVVDGSGGPRYRADVGVRNGQIAEIGRIRTNAARTIDADGLVLAPGFIDGHTHMDAQVAWDPHGSCSHWHGVTTVVMGNCGFALAPCKPKDREWFARCLEAVEDIPIKAMLEGINWDWETFPEYLETVKRLPKGVNYAAYIGHSALRMYVMGERGTTEKANEDDIKAMRAQVREALLAGAMGVSTSRSHTHITPDNAPVASRVADWSEIEQLVEEMTELNVGIFQIGPNVSSGAAHRAGLDQLGHLAIESGRPVMFGVLDTRQGVEPIPWHYQTDFIDRIAAAGGRMFGQANTRSLNAIFSMKSYLPFDQLPTWAKVRALSIEEQKGQFADPDIRRKLVAEEKQMEPRGFVMQGGSAATLEAKQPNYANLFAMKGVAWDDPTVDQLSRETGNSPVEVMLDLMLADEDQIFYQPLVNHSPHDVLGILRHPRTLATFSDSGAHVCQEMGSSLQTHLISYWVRDHQAFTLEEAVRKLTFDIASAFDLEGRGLVRRGYAADLVLFDETRIQPKLPTVETDLPGGARRLVQKAEGIAATIVNGVVTLEKGESTGNFSGQLLRNRLAS